MSAAVQRLMLPVETAEALRISPRTLEKMRLTGSPLRFVRVGRRCLYDPADVAAYVEASKFASTAEASRK